MANIYNNNDVPGDQSWRTHLQADSRLRIVNKILDTLKKHLLVSSPEGLLEITSIAVRFEEKVYTAASSQSDYLRKISLKMLTMETSHNTGIVNVVQQRHTGPESELHDGETSWQTQFPDDYRLRIFKEILNTSRTHLPIRSAKDLLEATKSAVTFEKQIYNSAPDQSDYLSKIALQMLSIEVNSQNSDVATPSPQSAVIIN